MKIEKICLLGGSGFVGRHIAHQLSARGLEVRVLTRNRERAKDLLVLPTADVIEADVHDEAELQRHFTGRDAVINLVGILHETGSDSFERVHTELARKVVGACVSVGVQRLLHMSALNAAPNGPSAYLRSKGSAEALVRASGLATTVFRPSVIFGPGDSFLSLFARLVRVSPVIPLACPNARFQPIFVEDVARAFVESLSDPATFGKSFDLCGPKTYTLKQLVEYTASVMGRQPRVIGLPDGLSYLQATLLEWSPVKLMTRDNYRSMQVDSVCSCDFPFPFRPTTLEAVAPLYLAGETPRARYNTFRYRARR